MAGPGGIEVGRVHIRVVPDFTYFIKIMRAQLAYWDNRQLDWKVNVDTSEIKQAAKEGVSANKQIARSQAQTVRKAAAAARKAGVDGEEALTGNKARLVNRLRGDLNRALTGLEVRLKLAGVDDVGLRAAWDQEEAYFNKRLSKITPKIGDIDLSLIGAELEKYLESLKRRSIEIPVRYEFESALRQWLDAEKDFVREYLNAEQTYLARVRKSWEQRTAGFITSGGDLAVNLNEIRAMNAETQRLARSAADARVQIDKAFLAANPVQARQALREYALGFRDLEGRTLRLSSYTDKIRMRGGIIGGLLGGAAAVSGAKVALGVIDKVGSAGKSVGGILSKLTPSFGTGLNLPAYALIAALITPVIALLSGLITAAPAAIAAVAVPIGVIALGIDGIKKAAESVGPAFTKLKEDVSSVFESGLIPGFNDVKDKLIPGLTSSFKGVALNLSNLFNGFMDNLTQEGNMSSLNNIIANTGVAAERALPGVKNFTTGILNLVSQLSNKFPGLSDAFNRTAESFLGWVNKITTVDSSGTTQLDRAMKTLGDTLSSLGGIISDLFSSGFNNLGDAKFGDSMKSFV